jgi:hypothetical protein
MINQGGTQGGGEGTFTSSDMVGGNLRTTHIMIGDMDGDGDIDAVRTVFNPYAAGSSTQLLTNDGSGNFTASTIAGVGNRAINVALGDLDSDGDLDMVVSQYGGNDTVTSTMAVCKAGPKARFRTAVPCLHQTPYLGASRWPTSMTTMILMSLS